MWYEKITAVNDKAAMLVSHLAAGAIVVSPTPTHDYTVTLCLASFYKGEI